MSDVVGTSLICDNETCPLNAFFLMTNVTVFLEHSQDLRVSEKNNVFTYIIIVNNMCPYNILCWLF